MIYDPTQLRKDLKLILATRSRTRPLGFYNIRCYEDECIYVQSLLPGSNDEVVLIDQTTLDRIDLENLPLNSKIGQRILQTAMKIEESFQTQVTVDYEGYSHTFPIR
jgi:hypothetical protein